MSSSSSDASQSQLQDTQDNRISSAVGSVNLVTNRSSVGNVNISQTDQGAVAGAFGFASANSDSAFKFANATNDSAAKLVNAASDSAFKFGEATVGKSFDFASAIASGAANELAASGARQVAVTKDAMTAVQDAYGGAASEVKAAYQNTTDKIAGAYTEAKAGEQKVMVAVGLAIVGMVALKALGRSA
jgi:hypothetical protein